VDAVAEQEPDIEIELALGCGTKLPLEGGSVGVSVRGYLYCLTKELAFLAMQ
jgi:hypothetical protein